MPPTSRSSTPASTAASWPTDTAGLTCAIHQPNFLPRLSTLAKLFAADIWIVLDDVQFNRRDYQHRARLTAPERPGHHRWLTLPVHRPYGRATRINDVLLSAPAQTANRVRGTLRRQLSTAMHGRHVEDALHPVFSVLETATHLAPVAELSTRVLLDTLGWPGTTLQSSEILTRTGRSERLLDLVLAVSATTYLCGTGGARYLEVDLFQGAGVSVAFSAPSAPALDAPNVSAIMPLARQGPDVLASELRAIRATGGAR